MSQQSERIGDLDAEKFFARLEDLEGPIDDGSGDLVEEDFIDKLVQDPSAPPAVRALTGYLGRSKYDDRWRLYSGLDLDEYVEFEKDAKVFAYKVTARSVAAGLTRTIVWLERDAKIWYSRGGEEKEINRFLHGTIADLAAGADGDLGVIVEGPLGRFSSRSPC